VGVSDRRGEDSSGWGFSEVLSTAVFDKKMQFLVGTSRLLAPQGEKIPGLGRFVMLEKRGLLGEEQGVVWVRVTLLKKGGLWWRKILSKIGGFSSNTGFLVRNSGKGSP